MLADESASTYNRKPPTVENSRSERRIFLSEPQNASDILLFLQFTGFRAIRLTLIHITHGPWPRVLARAALREEYQSKIPGRCSTASICMSKRRR
jgi:hypothetical protein